MWSEARYLPSRDQLDLVSTIGDSLGALLPISRLHQSAEETEEVWESLSEMGVFEIALPEDQGGSGLSLIEEALITVKLGGCLVSPSVLATIITAGNVQTLGETEPLPRVTLGYVKNGKVTLVKDQHADLVLVSSGEGIEVYTYPKSAQSVENHLWMVDICQTDIEALGEAHTLQSNIQYLRVRLLCAAMLTGLSQAAIDMAVEYAGLREQFGRPIGSFQAIKHHCANMALATRSAQDQVKFAAIALDDGRPDAELQVESAYFVSAKAAVESAAKNIQIHGGVGYSHEADAHLILKCAKLLSMLTGGQEAALARISNLKLAI